MAKAPADIRSLARAHTETAINTLVGIMRDRKAPPSARVAAATALTDRGWGKPLQTEIRLNAGKLSELTDQEIIARLDELTDKTIDNTEQSDTKH